MERITIQTKDSDSITVTCKINEIINWINEIEKNSEFERERVSQFTKTLYEFLNIKGN